MTRATRSVLYEQVKPWSYMKFPFLASLGPERGWYKVGPLARVQNCDFIPTPLAEAERQEFVAHGEGHPVHAPLAYHWARMVEMLHAGETIQKLLQDDDLTGSDLVRSGRAQPRGRRRHRGPARHAHPSVPRRGKRSGDPVQSDRLDHPQQPADERGHPRGGPALPERAQDHRSAAQSHRSRDPRLRSLPVVRHARPRPDAARAESGRCARRAAGPDRARRERRVPPP